MTRESDTLVRDTDVAQETLSLEVRALEVAFEAGLGPEVALDEVYELNGDYVAIFDSIDEDGEQRSSIVFFCEYKEGEFPPAPHQFKVGEGYTQEEFEKPAIARQALRQYGSGINGWYSRQKSLRTFKENIRDLSVNDKDEVVEDVEVVDIPAGQSRNLRDIMYGILDLQEGDSAREQIKTSWWALGESVKRRAPEHANSARFVVQGIIDIANDASPNARKVAAGVVAAATLATTIPHTDSGDSYRQPAIQEVAGAESKNIQGETLEVRSPEWTNISYVVPENSPRVKDLATALGVSSDEVIEQISGSLEPESQLPVGNKIDLRVQAVNYTSGATETIPDIVNRFNVPVGVLLAANPRLVDIVGTEVIEGDVLIPRPVSIVQMPEGAKVSPEQLIASPEISELTDGDVNNIAEVDPGFDGRTLVLDEALEIKEVTLPVLAKQEPSGETITTPEVVVSPEVERVNNALDSLQLADGKNDITELRNAVIAMYSAYKTQDADRMPNTPEGIIKMMLHHEAQGLNVPFTVAERTADVERFASAETYAVFLATAKLYQLRVERDYPQLMGTMLRMRDGNGPAHMTHNDGSSLDISSANGWEVEQYADGPFGDYQFSEMFNKQFNIDLLIDMGNLEIDGKRAVRRILFTGNTVNPAVNSALGYELMQNKQDHKEHFHLVMNSDFDQPRWRPRVGELPWGEVEDLKLGKQSRPITVEQHASQHADFEQYIGALLGGEVIDTDAEVSAQEKYQKAVNAFLDEISSGEGDWNSVNTGKPGDTPTDSSKYDSIFDGRDLSDLTIAEVRELQINDQIRAVGRYQFMPDTLAEAIEYTGIDTSAKFDSKAQNILAVEYLIFAKRPQLSRYLAGNVVPIARVVKDVCKEWASMPCMDGSGYYDGDSAGNKASGGQDRVKEVIRLLENLRTARMELNQE